MSASRLIGTWSLLSWEAQSAEGEKSYPFGQSLIGYIIYSTDGYMSVVIMQRDRPHFKAGDLLSGTQEESSAAAATYLSYMGRYESFEDKVVHYIEASLFPNWIGTTQERFCEINGDRLTLSTPPLLAGGSTHRHYLVWERVISTQLGTTHEVIKEQGKE